MATAVASHENDADRRASKDLPHLSLSLESPPSSSPFPSPSSSFIPPPMPGPHEYANKLLIPASKKKQRESTDSNSPAVATTPAVASAPVSATSNSNGATPAPPSVKPSLEERLEQMSSSIDWTERRASLQTQAKRASLSSSRRAPPSPSVSRRASCAHNNNNRASVSLSRAPSNATTARRRSRSVKIRDFAYSPSDLRHVGQGPDAPRPGRSRATSEYEDMLAGSGSNSRRNSGWGAFRWAGSKLWGFAIGGAAGKQRSGADADGFMPTSSDFARNFDVSSPNEEHPTSGFQVPDDSEVDEEEDDDDYPDQDVPLLPGLYRALYAFVPEGTAEMALTEDQIVKVIGRGGGVGWAVAIDEAGNHALVPESYLEPMQIEEPSVDAESDANSN